MIGNDIIDLEVAAEQSKPLRRGYFDKVFTIKEQELIHSSGNLIFQNWLLWSMKESAYKAHQRRFKLPRSFDPKQMKCSVFFQDDTSASGTVEIQGSIYNSHIAITKLYLFCTASIFQQKEISSQIYPASEDLKKRLLSKFSAEKNSPVQMFDIQKNEYGIPFLKYKNKILNVPFSLSHHGKFSGLSMPLMNY